MEKMPIYDVCFKISISKAHWFTGASGQILKTIYTDLRGDKAQLGFISSDFIPRLISATTPTGTLLVKTQHPQ